MHLKTFLAAGFRGMHGLSLLRPGGGRAIVAAAAIVVDGHGLLRLLGSVIWGRPVRRLELQSERQLPTGR